MSGSRFEVMIGGCMGSHHSAVRRGLTTSIGVIIGPKAIVIDNGSGVINVARWIMSKGDIKEVSILQTHLHTDHTCGMPQNSLLFQREIPVTGIFSPVTGNRSVKMIYDQIFHESNWPVNPETFGLRHNIEETGTEYCSGNVNCFPLNHPGGCVGYRIDHEGKSVVIATDHEPLQNMKIDRKYAEMIEGVDLLIADMQYTDDEYAGRVGIDREGKPMSRKGWGHGTPGIFDAVVNACTEKPKVVLVTHHDPNRTNEELSLLGSRFGSIAGVKTYMAADKMPINIYDI